jgi:hypothetical protein
LRVPLIMVPDKRVGSHLEAAAARVEAPYAYTVQWERARLGLDEKLVAR